MVQGWTEIAALYVLPEFRGRGIGEALFRAAWDIPPFKLARDPILAPVLGLGFLALSSVTSRQHARSAQSSGTSPHLLILPPRADEWLV